MRSRGFALSLAYVVALLVALGSIGCSNPAARSPRAWTVERYLPPYGMRDSDAEVRPAAEPGIYELVREHEGEGNTGKLLEQVTLQPGQSIGFEPVNVYEAWAIAGSTRHRVRTTYGVRYVWYRRPTRLEATSAEALRTAGAVTEGTARVLGWLGGLVAQGLIEAFADSAADALRESNASPWDPPDRSPLLDRNR